MARNYHIFDVVIIGAGSAGIAALQEALAYTKNVVLVEKGKGGTTCAQTGCMPSKALIHAARLYNSRKKFEEAGIDGAEHLRADIPRILERVRQSRDHFVKGVKEELSSISHYIVRGEASFDSASCVRVGGKLYHTHSVIIATGSTPFIPEVFAQIPKDRLITSDTLFEQKNLPKRIGFVGLGPLGLEIAQALSQLDREVIAVHNHSTLGGISNPSMSHAMQQVLEQTMTVHMDAQAEASMAGDHIHFKVGSKSYEVDAVFLSAGRNPSVASLKLQCLKVPMNDSGVPRYDPITLQLPDMPVFIAGDATDERAILHEAVLEGKIAAYNAVHYHQERPSHSHLARYVPLNIIFTEPNIASVGARWQSLQGHDVIMAGTTFRNQGRAVIEQRNKGCIQLFLDPDDTTLMGAELLAPEGEHIAHLLALAIQQQMTAKQVLKMPFYHPTFEEALRTALKSGVKQFAM